MAVCRGRCCRYVCGPPTGFTTRPARSQQAARFLFDTRRPGAARPPAPCAPLRDARASAATRTLDMHRAGGSLSRGKQQLARAETDPSRGRSKPSTQMPSPPWPTRMHSHGCACTMLNTCVGWPCLHIPAQPHGQSSVGKLSRWDAHLHIWQCDAPGLMELAATGAHARR